MLVGCSQRPTEVGVGLAIQRVEAGAGSQINWVALTPKVGVAVVARRVKRPVEQARHRILVMCLARRPLGASRAPLDSARSHGWTTQSRACGWATTIGGRWVRAELNAIRQAVQWLSFAAFSSGCKLCSACDMALAVLCRQSKSQSPQ